MVGSEALKAISCAAVSYDRQRNCHQKGQTSFVYFLLVNFVKCGQSSDVDSHEHLPLSLYSVPSLFIFHLAFLVFTSQRQV